MRYLPAILLLVACPPSVGVELENAKPRGPELIVKGEGYAIHVLRGRVGQRDVDAPPLRGGYAVRHTNTVTGEVTWLLRTGSQSYPTRRVSHSVTRLIGVYPFDGHLALAYYDSGRLWGTNLPSVYHPPADKGHYRLVAFESESGNRIHDSILELGERQPDRVPEETTGLGVFEETDDGFTVLGTRWKLDAGGNLAETNGPK
jgi:hypothetical protein